MKLERLGTALAVVLLLGPARGQEGLPRVWSSPLASVTQTIGLSEVSVQYNRPAVSDRELWGGLVSYGQVWRAGANENTIIRFDGDVFIEGQELAAGAYGLHMIPRPESWTIIFSRNSSSWGSYFYDEADDALRVEVTPVAAPFAEHLTYDFVELGEDTATCRLWWGELAVPFRITVDLPGTMVKHIREHHLRNLAAFSWRGWYDAARYCSLYEVNQEEAVAWADRSIGMKRNFSNLWVRYELLDALDRDAEAERARGEALAAATEADLNQLGYEYMASARLDRAIRVFASNAEIHPESWNVHDSLAQALAARGDVDEAIELYTRALALVDDQDQKVRISRTLEELRSR